MQIGSTSEKQHKNQKKKHTKWIKNSFVIRSPCDVLVNSLYDFSLFFFYRTPPFFDLFLFFPPSERTSSSLFFKTPSSRLLSVSLLISQLIMAAAAGSRPEPSFPHLAHALDVHVNWINTHFAEGVMWSGESRQIQMEWSNSY